MNACMYSTRTQSGDYGHEKKKERGHEKKKERFLTKEALNCFTNSPCQYYMKYTRTSMENKHIDG